MIFKNKDLIIGQVDETKDFITFGKVYGFKKTTPKGYFFQIQTPFSLKRKVVHPGTFEMVERPCNVKFRIARVNSKCEFDWWFSPHFSQQEEV